MIARKPISLGMTIALATDLFNICLNIPDFEKGLEKKFSEMPAVMTPEEFDISWDKFFKLITGEKKE